MFKVYDLLTTISHADLITFYDYREARPEVRLASFPADNLVILRIQECLQEAANGRWNNHILFDIKKGNHNFSIMFSDGEMILGLGVNTERW